MRRLAVFALSVAWAANGLVAADGNQASDLGSQTTEPAAKRQAAIAAALNSDLAVAPSGQDAGPKQDVVSPLPPAPHTFVSGPGQFEVSSFDLDAAGAGVALAEEVWQSLQRPLDLPERGFPTTMTIRLLPATQWSGPVPFRASAEMAGQVTVRVRWSTPAESEPALRRALVQALLMRTAIAWHGLGPSLRVPFWLEQACFAWSLTHTHAALMDEWQEDSALVAPPSLAGVLALNRATPPTREEELGSLWLMAHLQSESGPDRRWPVLLRALLGGEDAAPAVGRIYGGYFADEAARELWWQVGWHAQRRLSATAVNRAADSRAWVAGRSRWVAQREGTEVVLSLDQVFAARKEPWVAAELQLRIGQLQGGLGSNLLHPFYRNAALSMGRVYEAAKAGDARAFAAAAAEAKQDFADGLELEKATDQALDQLEAKQKPEAGGQRPEDGDQKPVTGEQKPNASSANPADGETGTGTTK